MDPLRHADPHPPSRPPGSVSLTGWSLAALAAGLLLGTAGHASGAPVFSVFARVVQPVGDLWIAALQMTVLPLVIAHLLASVLDARTAGSLGALGGRALVLFVLMLVAAGLFALAVAPPVIGWFHFEPAVITSLTAATPVPASAREAASAGMAAMSLGELLPSNLVEAALHGDILPLLLFTVLFGSAVSRLPDEHRLPLESFFRGLAQAMLLCIRWLLWGTPAGVFALTYGMALGMGAGAAGMLAVFVGIVSGTLLLFTALLYPLSAALGRTSLGVFARAAMPAQLVAIGTRSSIAALPALIQGGREHLRLPPAATGLVLPLSVSLFKANRTLSGLVKLLFLAHVYQVQLRPETLAVFLATVILLSFGTLGVPSGGSAFKTLPAYLAAGVPIEGVVILEAVDAIPDIFKTLLNVTADMSVATLLSRSSRPAPGTVAWPAGAAEPFPEGAA